MNDSEKRSVKAIKKATTSYGHTSFIILIVHRHLEELNINICSND